MEKIKIIAGIIVFGSIWGFAECIIGPLFEKTGLPSGVIMTSIFAIGLMMITRLLFKRRGMQLGMGLVAGLLRLFNPFGACVICSAIAIAAEGLIFELIWYKISLDFNELKSISMKISMGIITSYSCYVGGYILTQIFTPIIASNNFYFENLMIFIPQILSRGFLAIIFGSVTISSIFILKKFDITLIRDRIYYPIVTTVTVLCWFIVIINTLLQIII
jgi:hypothetical protein